MHFSKRILCLLATCFGETVGKLILLDGVILRYWRLYVHRFCMRWVYVYYCDIEIAVSD